MLVGLAKPADAAPPEAPPPAAPLAQPPPPPPPALAPPPNFSMAPPNAWPTASNGGWGRPLGWLPPWPTRLEYEEGDAIPTGYELKTKPERGLLVSGLITLLVPYGLTFVIAGAAFLDGGSRTREQVGPLLLPVVGSFIPLSYDETYSEAEAFFFLANGFAQTAGAAMIVASVLVPDKYLQRMGRFPGQPRVSIGLNSAAVQFRF